MSGRGSFGSYESGGGYGSYHSGAPPSSMTQSSSSNDFTRLSQSVSNNIQKITQNVAQLQRMVGQIGTSQDSPDLRDRLHQVQHYTNQLAKDTKNYLTDLSHLPNPPNQSEQKQRRMQRDRLMNDFTTSLNNFQAAQRKAADKEKESIARARAHSGSHDPFADDRKSDEQLVSFDSYGQPSKLPAPSGGQQQTLQMEEDVDLELMREREQAVRKLESDIMDVNQIFKDLGMLVHEQGEVIDSIEANVENAAVHVEDGAEQLRQARDYQSKARRKKCIILIVVLIILAIIATIIAVSVKK